MSNKHVISDWAFLWLAALAVVLLGSLAYVNTFDGEWVWDDASSVLLHRHVQDPGKFFQLFREDQHTFGRGQGNFYRPLLSVTFMLDYLISYDPERDARPDLPYPDVQPFWFHVSSLAWHLAAALLLLLLLQRLGAPRFVCAAAPILFVLHPLHTEAVAYISGRADMMSAALMFAGLYLSLDQPSPRRQVIAFVFSLLFFIGALLSKESSLIYPVLLALVVFLRPVPEEASTQRKQVYFKRALPLLGAAVVVAAYAVLRSTVLHFADAAPGPESTFGQRLFETGQAFIFYIQKLFWPTRLHMEQTLVGTPPWTAYLGAFLLALIVAALVWAGRTGRWRVALGMGWFIAAWFPISGIFPLNAPMAEHWMYVPMAGFWWALLELINEFARTAPARRLAMAGAFALCVVFLALTIRRNDDWHSNASLFTATLRENPSSIRVHYNLAVAYEDIEHNLPGARRHYEAILDHYEAQKRAQSPSGNTQYLLEEEIEIRLSLGRVLMRQGVFNRAILHYLPVTSLKDREKHGTEIAAAAMGMGRCLMAMGDPGQADYFFGQAIQIEPALRAEVEAIMMGAPLQNRT